MKKSTRKRYSTGKRVSYAQGDPVYKTDDGDKNNRHTPVAHQAMQEFKQGK